MNKAGYGDRAIEYFDSGYNCAESAFKGLCDAMGKEVNPSVVSGFGGGVGRTDSLLWRLDGSNCCVGDVG